MKERGGENERTTRKRNDRDRKPREVRIRTKERTAKRERVTARDRRLGDRARPKPYT